MFGNAIKKGAMNSVKKLIGTTKGREDLLKMIENSQQIGRAVYIDKERNLHEHKGDVFFNHQTRNIKITGEFEPIENDSHVFKILMGSQIGMMVAAAIPPEKVREIINQMQPNNISDAIIFLSGRDSKNESFFYYVESDGVSVFYERARLLEISGDFFEKMGDFVDSDGASIIDEITDKMTE